MTKVINCSESLCLMNTNGDCRMKFIGIGKDGVCVEGVTFMADNRKKQPSTELTITDGMWEEKSSFEDAPW